MEASRSPGLRCAALAFAIVAGLVRRSRSLRRAVVQRGTAIPENGVRTALGAQRTDVVALVLRQAALITGAGLIAGLIAAAMLRRWLGTLLYGVNAPSLSFAGVAVVIAVCRRARLLHPGAAGAVRIDPLRALRGL